MKIKHILLSIVLVLVCGFSFINVEASVKETIDDFSGNTYIIGSTKFDNDTIITAGRAAQAGSDDAVIRYMKTGVFERVEVKIYLYNERAEAWFEIPVDETKDIVILDEKEVKSLEENLDIFFVNNEEKQLEFPYSGDIDLETLESNESVSGLKVTYKDGKFYIPATTTNVSFKDSEGEDIYISTGYDTEDEEYGLGEFYIPKRVKAVDESGKDLGISILAAKDGLVYDYGNLYSFSKPYYDLYYVDKNGVEIDFYTWKVTEDTTIKQAWHPIGDLVTDNFSYEFESEKQFIVHKGNLYKTDGGYYFNARIIAPHGYDTSDTLVNGEKVVFKEVGIAGEDAHMEAIVKVPITQLNEVNVVVDWEEGEKVTFNVKISQDVNYVYNATFYNNADEIIDTKEADSWGGLVQKTDIVLKKDNAVHIGWTLEKNSNELYDFNTSLTNNIKLYPVFVSLKDFILKSVVNDAVYHAILPSDIKLTETVVLDFDGDISLDLNGHDVSIANVHAIRLKGNNTLLNVTNGTFTTTGNAAGLAIGTDKESTSSVTRRSLYVGSDVIINAETFGIVAFGKSQLDFYGTINISGDGYGISGNGNPNNEGTIFNIHEGAIINAPNGAAIYQPQQGTTNINGGTFEANTILGIKAGNLNVSDGTFKAIGTPTNPKASNNGINLTGDIFLAEENASYADHIIIDITGGIFETNGGAVVREFNPSIGTENERTVTVRGLYNTRVLTELKNVFVYVDSSLGTMLVNETRYTAKDFAYALELSSDEDRLQLLNSITLAETALIDADKNMYLTLNGHTITANGFHAIRLKGNNSSLSVDSGAFKITGDWAAIAIGENKEDTTNVIRRNLSVNSGVTINAETFGIVAFGKSQLDFYGTINISGDGYGISGNGNPNNEGTIFNIHEGAIINAPNGAAIYQPQQGTTNINGGTFEANTILGIKAGNLNVSDGTFKAIGTPTNPKASNNGINLTGDIFLAEENASYADHIIIDVRGGSFETNGGAIIKEFNPSIGTENERTVTVYGLYTTREVTNIANTFNYVSTDLAKVQLKAVNYTQSGLKYAIEHSDNMNYAMLLDNLVLTETVLIDADRDMHLDLNDKDISIANVHAIRLKGNNSSLTVSNGTFTTTGNAAGLAVGTDKEDASGVTKRNLIVESDVIINVPTFGIVVFGKSQLDFYGTINVSGDGYGISGNGNPNNEGTVFNIYEGSIINAPYGAAIYQPQQGTTNITGGTFEANTILGIKAGNLNVSGGKFTATGTPTAPVASNNGINLTGDIFLAEENASYADHIVIDITAGTFNVENGGAVVKEFNPSIGTENERIVTVKGLYETRNETDLENVFVYTATAVNN